LRCPFGFVEATVVVYFRAAAGLSPDYKGALSQVQQLEEGNQLDPGTITQFPKILVTVEMVRAGATIVMLVAIALLAASRARERWAIFLWTFALWDISRRIPSWKGSSAPFDANIWIIWCSGRVQIWRISCSISGPTTITIAPRMVK
jgi:hypothetical protein